MKCLKCGKECGNENFCSNCGTPLIKETPTQEQSVPNENIQNESYYSPYGNENRQSTSNGTYNYTNFNQQPPTQPTSKSNIGIWAFILGLAGLFFSCISSVGLILDIAAIVCGIIGITKKQRQVCAIAGIICGIIGILFFSVSLSVDTTNTNSEAVENTQVIVSTEHSSDPSTKNSNDSEKKEVKKEQSKKRKDTKKGKNADLEKEFKKSCQKFNYKKIARNPDVYIGQNVKVTVQIYSISEGGLFTQAYMKAYTDDGSGTYFDNMIYIFDDQDKNSDSYVHVLEDDVITVYGTFEGMEDSTNFLNGEKSKDIALHMKYVKLIKE